MSCPRVSFTVQAWAAYTKQVQPTLHDLSSVSASVALLIDLMFIKT